MNINGEEKPATVKVQNSWAMEKIGKPVLWIGAGFILCKILDAYTEGKRVRRIEA